MFGAGFFGTLEPDSFPEAGSSGVPLSGGFRESPPCGPRIFRFRGFPAEACPWRVAVAPRPETAGMRQLQKCGCVNRARCVIRRKDIRARKGAPYENRTRKFGNCCHFVGNAVCADKVRLMLAVARQWSPRCSLARRNLQEAG